MANVAVVSYDFAVVANVLAVVTTESERLGSAGTIVAQKTEALRKALTSAKVKGLRGFCSECEFCSEL